MFLAYLLFNFCNYTNVSNKKPEIKRKPLITPRKSVMSMTRVRTTKKRIIRWVAVELYSLICRNAIHIIVCFTTRFSSKAVKPAVISIFQFITLRRIDKVKEISICFNVLFRKEPYLILGISLIVQYDANIHCL